jgi:hypothetical protein
MDGMEQRTSIDVAASPDRVWEVLVDVERWPEWTDSVSSVRPLDAGPLAVGSRVEISQPRIPTGTYTVTALELGSAFTWEQRQPGSTVSAHHECAPLPDGGTRVGLRVVMSGEVGGVRGPAVPKAHRAVPSDGGGRPQGPRGGHRSLKRRASTPPRPCRARPGGGVAGGGDGLGGSAAGVLGVPVSDLAAAVIPSRLAALQVIECLATFAGSARFRGRGAGPIGRGRGVGRGLRGAGG